ncbi:MAG: cytochrome c oxidase subunit II [Actinomycetota bacterium]|nr:cytochrome c oxidase subunit II [Actinomycetota bacterium]
MRRTSRGPVRRGRRPAGYCTALAVLLPVLAGCSTSDLPRFGWPRGITKQANLMLTLWSASTIAALVVGCVVWGLIFWSVLRYRRRPGDDMPRQVAYNLPIEVLYTVIPFLIIAVLFFYTAVDESVVNKETAHPDVQVSVLAFKWNWQFGYVGERDNNNNFVQTVGSSDEIPILVLPANKRVLFTENSDDVIHSFYVPEFLFKRDVIPGRTNSFEVTITRTGAFVGRCAEFCGTYHAFMNFELRVVSSADFDRWLADKKQGMTTAQALKAIGQPPYATTTHPFPTDRGQQAQGVGGKR